MTRRRPITFLASAAVIPLAALAVVGTIDVANAGTTHPSIESERPVQMPPNRLSRLSPPRRRRREGWLNPIRPPAGLTARIE